GVRGIAPDQGAAVPAPQLRRLVADRLARGRRLRLERLSGVQLGTHGVALAEPSHIVFAAGGTGGHVFPALAVADELRGRRPASRIVFMGGRRGLENRLV